MDEKIVEQYIKIVEEINKAETFTAATMQQMRRQGFLEGVKLIYGEEVHGRLIIRADFALMDKYPGQSMCGGVLLNTGT